MEKDSVLEMRHIYKTFPGVKALQNVDFTLKKRRNSCPDGGKWRRKIHADQSPDGCRGV